MIFNSYNDVIFTTSNYNAVDYAQNLDRSTEAWYYLPLNIYSPCGVYLDDKYIGSYELMSYTEDDATYKMNIESNVVLPKEYDIHFEKYRLEGNFLSKPFLLSGPDIFSKEYQSMIIDKSNTIDTKDIKIKK